MEVFISQLMSLMEDEDDGGAIALVREAQAAGVSAQSFLKDILVPVMNELGNRFSRMELFLPDLIYAADVAKLVKDELSEVLKAGNENISGQGKVVIGTVQGDVHDIGKSMVATILEVYGYEVIDLGNDVSVFDFINAADRENADIIALSSLLTTSMPYMEELVETLVALGKRDKYKVIVGGGPISQEYADRIGADGYSNDATEAADLCQRLLGNSGEEGRR